MNGKNEELTNLEEVRQDIVETYLENYYNINNASFDRLIKLNNHINKLGRQVKKFEKKLSSRFTENKNEVESHKDYVWELRNHLMNRRNHLKGIIFNKIALADELLREIYREGIDQIEKIGNLKHIDLRAKFIPKTELHSRNMYGMRINELINFKKFTCPLDKKLTKEMIFQMQFAEVKKYQVELLKQNRNYLTLEKKGVNIVDKLKKNDDLLFYIKMQIYGIKQAFRIQIKEIKGYNVMYRGKNPEDYIILKNAELLKKKRYSSARWSKINRIRDNRIFKINERNENLDRIIKWSEENE